MYTCVCARAYVRASTDIYIYIYIYPVALRAKPATVPTHEAQDPKIQPISIKLGPKIHQVGNKNPSSWDLKSYKIGPRRCLGGVLGPSWSQEAPKKHQDTNKGPPWPLKGTALAPPRTALAPLLKPKIDLKGIQKDIFFMIIF